MNCKAFQHKLINAKAFQQKRRFKNYFHELEVTKFIYSENYSNFNF